MVSSGPLRPGQKKLARLQSVTGPNGSAAPVSCDSYARPQPSYSPHGAVTTRPSGPVSPARCRAVAQRRFTARAATMAKVPSEIEAWMIISTFAHAESTGTSVGENAVLVLNARNR